MLTIDGSRKHEQSNRKCSDNNVLRPEALTQELLATRADASPGAGPRTGFTDDCEPKHLEIRIKKNA